MSEQENDPKYIEYRKALVGSNVEKLKAFVESRECHSLTIGNNPPALVNGNEYDVRHAAFRVDGSGRVIKIARTIQRFNENEAGYFGSIGFGFPIVKVKDGRPVEPNQGLSVISCSFQESTTKEVVDIMHETNFTFNVAKVKTLRDLFVAIDLYSGVLSTNSGEIISKEYLKNRIVDFMEGKLGEEYITSKYGLRDRVVELKLNGV